MYLVPASSIVGCADAKEKMDGTEYSDIPSITVYTLWSQSLWECMDLKCFFIFSTGNSRAWVSSATSSHSSTRISGTTKFVDFLLSSTLSNSSVGSTPLDVNSL